jgi:hypothetical protein
MSSTTWPGNPVWPLWQKILFRFFFIYFIFFAKPWLWFWVIPGVEELINKNYHQVMEWSSKMANDKIFHLYKTIPYYGDGDTSSGWVRLCLFLLIAFIGCLVWSLLDAKKSNYNRLAYWFRIILRYTLVLNCFSYGFQKLFLLQMPSPSLNQLATPLGDYLGKNLLWATMGASPTYQFFSGFIEVFAGILLLFRRTAFFGTIVALGVFTNVMMMNLGYDVGVKSFSIHLVILCLVLLAFEYKRIAALLFNKVMPAGNLYSPSFSKRWVRITALTAKLGLVALMVVYPLQQNFKWYKERKPPKPLWSIKPGIYEVKTFVLNKDTLPLSYSDTLRWKDMIYENGDIVSVSTLDTMFRQRYSRGYFWFNIDSSKKNVDVLKKTADFKTFNLGKLHFEMPDTNSVILSGMLRRDSVYALLVRMNRHFQLTEKQFHWTRNYVRE